MATSIGELRAVYSVGGESALQFVASLSVG